MREIIDDLKMKHFVCQVYYQLFFTSSDCHSFYQLAMYLQPV